ncbi:ArsR family transcriptional regulator [Periweissella cryptocerci]|uniref:ArsR family transcriptional regulator n=1 Tax=Periweissella cryptocerci TaxID=2506420 RepID=A0A4P6YV75_9LACO|nr:metalloregulator ArsR/SmtB family transcription factor [Periweissella cryptocerci]QBO36680.1 ArsR family transcriptional regulator [Periweissella cryptocerci]
MAADYKLIPADMLDEATKIARVLGNKTRIQILYLLEQDKLNVTELQGILGIEQSALSHQLQELRAYQLINQERKGKSIYYELTDLHILTTVNSILHHTEHVLLNRDHDGKLLKNDITE